MNKPFFLLSVLGAAFSAGAAWYDNPVVRASVVVDSATQNSDPHYINKSADDGLLMVDLNAADITESKQTVLFSLADLKSASGEVHGLGKTVVDAFGNAWKGGAISSDLKLMIPGSGTGSATSLIETDKTSWTGGSGLYPLTFPDSHKLDGMDFGSGSNYLYSNADSGSVLYRWTLPAKPYSADANALTLSASKQTSATRIRNISVYNVNGRELVYYGEGSGTSGRVWAMDVTDANSDNWKECEIVASGAFGEFKDITNVKLSNEDSVTPILYALSDAGKLAVCQLDAKGTSLVKIVRTFLKEDICDYANVYMVGELDGKFRNFEVSKDGSFAFFVNKTVSGETSVKVVSKRAGKGGQIVHTPREVLARMTNPGTDFLGATWTVYGRAMANDGTTSLLDGQAVVTTCPSARGIGSYNDWCFVVGTAEPMETVISGLGNLPIKPGDVVFHPANDKRVALRFTPPRNGRYSMSAQFYTINPGADGTVDVTVMLNGAVLMQEEVTHNGGQGAASSVCSHENLFLTTEDNLEFVVGPGFDNNNGCDSTALTLSIVEEGKDAFESLARYDATDAVATMLANGSFVNPCTTQGATWSLKGSTWSSWRQEGTTQWDDYYTVDSLPLEGPLSTPWAEGCPTVARTDDEWCRLAVNQSGGPVQMGIGRVGVNELLVHPGGSHYPTIRFAVPTRGTYLVTAVVRHLDRYDADSFGRDGVVLGLMAGGDQIAWANICCQNGENPIALVQAQTPILDAGETIDCQIHCGAFNYNDASTLRLTFVRLEDAAWKGLDIGRAVMEQFKDKGVTTSSFTDANGGRWTTGYTPIGLDGALTPFPETGSLNDGKLSGLTADGGATWVYLLANMTGSLLPGDWLGSGDSKRSSVLTREIVIHPGTDKDPVLRAQVPQRGYYNVVLHLRDIQPYENGKGVVMRMLKNGSEMISGFWSGWWNDYSGCFEASIRLKDVYLKPSDRLDFRLTCDGDNGCDLTALRGWIVPSGKKDDVFVPGLAIIVR